MLRRLITLGLDGIDFPTLNAWAAEGRLPVLRGLLEESRALILGASNRPMPGSIWTDIATGVSAAIHGYQHEEQLRVGSYVIEPVNASRVASPPFYKTLSDEGVRCAVVDFPVDYPLESFNGLHVVDWATEFKLWRFETRPQSMVAKLEHYDHPLTRYPGTRIGLDDLVALKRKLLRGIEIKRQFTVDLLRQREHEFVFVNFCELHKAGHFFWRFHDRAHPEFTDAVPELTDSLRDTYEALDRALAFVLAEVGDGDDLIIVTDRGMYSDHRADHLVEDVLAKLQWSAPRGRAAASPSQPSSSGVPLLSSRTAKKALKFVAQNLLPDSVREALLPFHRAMTGGPAPLDWTKTRVFKLPNVGNSYLRINLEGREPAGIVAAGVQYEALLSEIDSQFRALINPATGERVVEDVYFPGLQFKGPKNAELPDVAIVWNSRSPIEAVSSREVGTISGKYVSQRSGNHRPEGFALFRGPSFKSGTGNFEGDARQIAPAILHRFGIKPPAHYELQAPGPIVSGREGRSVRELRSPELAHEYEE